MQEEDYSICLTTLIIPEPLLDLFSWKLSVDQHFFFPLEPDRHILFTIVRTKISFILCGELLNRYPDFSRLCKNQKANPCSLNACIFYWIFFWIVRCGWAWLLFSLLASSHRLSSCQFISHSKPRQGGGLDFQKSKQIVVNRDHHFLSASKESILEVVGDYSTRRCCNVVCLALPIHLEHIKHHKVHRVMATWAT